MAWATAAGSTLTGFQDGTPTMRLCIQDATVEKVFTITDITQGGNTQAFTVPASTTLTAATMRGAKRWTYFVYGTALHQTTADSGSTWADVYATGNMGSLASSHIAGLDMATVVRTVDLEDVTNTGVAAPAMELVGKKSRFDYSINGHMITTATPLETDYHTTPVTMTLPLGSGTIAGASIPARVKSGSALNSGGPNKLAISGSFSDSCTLTTTPFNILTWAGDLRQGNSRKLTGDFIVPHLRTDIIYKAGNNVFYEFRALLTGTQTWAAA